MTHHTSRDCAPKPTSASSTAHGTEICVACVFRDAPTILPDNLKRPGSARNSKTLAPPATFDNKGVRVYNSSPRLQLPSPPASPLRPNNTGLPKCSWPRASPSAEYRSACHGTPRRSQGQTQARLGSNLGDKSRRPRRSTVPHPSSSSKPP